MAVLPNHVPRSELAGLKVAEFLRGTLNAALLGVDDDIDAGSLLADPAALDMIADVQMVNDQPFALACCGNAQACPGPHQHCGRPDPTAGIDARGGHHPAGSDLGPGWSVLTMHPKRIADCPDCWARPR